MTTESKVNNSDSKLSTITNLNETARQYIKWEPFELFSKQVSDALQTNNQSLLSSMFSQRISFGTAGLRSKMYGGYAFMNDLVIIQTTQGIIKYMQSLQTADEIVTDKQKGIVIGYDGRYHSKRFAELSSAIFLSQGYKIHWFNRFAATPLIPFAILRLNLCLGIVVTASHNPKLDNGFKVYWSNGAQIIPPHDVGISKFIQLNLAPWQTDYLSIDPCNTKRHNDMSVDVTDVVTDAYFNAISKWAYNRVNNKQLQLKVTYTAMHGVGGYWMTKAYEAYNLPSFVPVKQQFEPDPEFSTVEFPNPEEGAGALKLSFETADNNQSPLIIANDPDADRLAVAEKVGNEWRIFNGNEIATLLADYTFTNYVSQNKNCDRSKLCMVASTVSSKYLQAMARAEGFQFFDTLTGFKWIGNKAIDCVNNGLTFLFAYEVEIGFVIGDVSYDKDGLRAGTAFHEMAALLYAQNMTCSQKLEQLRAKYGYFEMTADYRRMTDEMVIQKMTRLRTGFNDTYPAKMGGFEITRVRDITTGYDSGEPDKKSKLPLQPVHHMLTFWFRNGATATIRNSGTEPKLKFYVETFDKKNAEDAKRVLKRMTNALLKEFMQMPSSQL